MIHRVLPVFAFCLLALCAGAALAQGQPEPWGIGLQKGATPVKTQLEDFHTLLMVLMTGVVVTVLGLLLYVSWRFRASKNPEPATFSHNTTVEIIWTVVPVIILVIIAIPSFRLIYFQERTPTPDLTIKATGYQWYWGYEYPDLGIGEYAAYNLSDEEIDPARGDVRLLTTDNKVVVPINANVQVLVTAGDVLHSFAVPSFGIKKDAVPGRLNETWFRVEEEGVYYGQCSELCGTGHAFMAIEVHALPQEQFERWVELAQENMSAATGYINELMIARTAPQLAAAAPATLETQALTITTAGPLAAQAR